MSGLGEIENPSREELVLILLGSRARHDDKCGTQGHSRWGRAGPTERSIKDAPSFPREETRPGEPSMALPQVGPLPASATVPPHNELLFSILESRDCSLLRFGLRYY